MRTGFNRRKMRDSYKIRSKNPEYIVSVEKTNKHISVTLSNATGRNVAGASTRSLKDVKRNKQGALAVANHFCDKVESMIDKNKRIVFNKSGYAFHGIVATVAEAIKDRGIKCI